MAFTSGNVKNLANLENAMFERFRVRMVFRVNDKLRVYDRLRVSAFLNRHLSDDMTVGQFREELVYVLNGHIAPRGGDYIPKLDVTEIAFISPRGISVHGNTLIKNVQFPI